MRKYLLFAMMFSGLMTGAQNLITNGNCKAQFKYEVNNVLMSPVPSTLINFTDKSEGNVTAWFWDFGDGATSQEQNPTHIYIQPVPDPTTKLSPYRNVSLTILTSDSCKSLYSEMINIVDGTIYYNPSCKAEFKYYQAAYDSLVGEASFQMTNLSEGDSLSYFWQFDNGTTSTEKEPMVVFDIKPDKHQASLTVTGKNNCSDTFNETIYFVDPNAPVIEPPACETNFGYSVNTKIQTFAPALVLDFYSKANPDGLEWNWDFGDGSSSNEQNPTHIFNFPLSKDSISGGTNQFRNVCLKVKTSSGCIASICQTIDIYMNTTPVEPPLDCSARFKYYQASIDTVAGTVTFQFNNYTEGDSMTYFWFFDNATTSTEHQPLITFDIKQLPLKASLTVQGKNCSDTYSDLVTLDKPIIYPPIEPDSTKCFTAFGYTVNYTNHTLLPALVLDFYAKSSPDMIEWNWDFGDGTTSTEPNPTHIFNLPLVKDSALIDPDPFRKVCLTAKTASGCMSTWCESINLYMNTTPIIPVPQCHALFKYEKATDLVSIPEVIPYRLWDASEGKVVSWKWTFEDGSISYEPQPVVSFDFQKPTQKVCLTILTADSCSSSWCDIIYVSGARADSGYVTKPPVSNYSMQITGFFPIQMSSCAGTAHAQVYLNDSLINASNYSWSTGAEGQDIKELCPTQSYTVKALTPDGTVVSETFIFNSDGTVTEVPVNWYVTGARDNWQIQYELINKNYTVEWQLCDGTIIRSDSIPFNSINCGGKATNMIVKDASTGEVVYTENISLNTLATRINPDLILSTVKLYPNPVTDVLNIQYSGNRLNEMQIEITDMAGKSVLNQKVYDVDSGQQIGMNVSSLRKGIYLCKMMSGGKLIGIGKMIK